MMTPEELRLLAGLADKEAKGYEVPGGKFYSESLTEIATTARAEADRIEAKEKLKAAWRRDDALLEAEYEAQTEPVPGLKNGRREKRAPQSITDQGHGYIKPYSKEERQVRDILGPGYG